MFENKPLKGPIKKLKIEEYCNDFKCISCFVVGLYQLVASLTGNLSSCPSNNKTYHLSNCTKHVFILCHFGHMPILIKEIKYGYEITFHVD